MSDDGAKKGILACFDDSTRAEFETFAVKRDFQKDDEVLKAGQYNSSLFIVTAGLLHARLDLQGGDTLLARLDAGNFFGEVSVFDPGATSARVIAVTKGSLLEIERDELLKFIEQHPATGAQFLLGLVQEIARRVRGADERLGDAVLLNRVLNG